MGRHLGDCTAEFFVISLSTLGAGVQHHPVEDLAKIAQLDLAPSTEEQFVPRLANTVHGGEAARKA